MPSPAPLPLGVMQGRLLPKLQGRYQAHPTGYWRDEFPIAAELGLSAIEFILDFDDAADNPLLASGGLDQIRAAAQASGVAVHSICADYFMEAPLHVADAKAAEKSLGVLMALLERAGELVLSDVVIPCVDQSSLKGEADQERLREILPPALALADRLSINLALETDLAPKPFTQLLERIGSERLTVNYDIGNSAALGFDPDEEWAAYGEKVTDLHVKDRTLGGGPVILGTGDADIPKVFALAEKYDFNGPIIMQAYRDEEGVAVFREQLAWLRERVEA